MKQITRFAFSILLIALLSTAVTMITGLPTLLIAAGLFALGAAKYFIMPGDLPTNMVYNFAITDTTYAGEAASSFIVKAITENVTVQGGHVYVKDGIKYKYTIPRWDADYEDLIQDRQATPVTKGTQNITGKSLTPADYMIYMEFNPRDFEAHWFQNQLDRNLLDTSLPVTLESSLVQEVIKRHSKYWNKQMWNGSTALSTIYKYYDGLKAKATADVDTLHTGSHATLDATNIDDKLLLGYAAIPDALKYDPDMKIFMGYAAYDLYSEWQIAQTYKGVDMTQNGVKKFRGLPVIPIPDMPANYFMIARGKADPTSNLWVGVNAMDDETYVQVARLQANSELFFVKMLMKADVAIGWASEVVTYENA